MKWVFHGVLIAVLLVQIGCRSTDDNAIGTEDGASIGASQADPTGAKPKKARGVTGRKGKPEVEEINEQPVFEAVEEPGAGEGEKDRLDPAESTEVLDSGALRRAKQHYELGDYDFAGEELRSIRKSSPSYEEAQQLLKELEAEAELNESR